MQRVSNRLASEKSPYLLQHQHNPVDWYPWGTEAFKRAKEEQKPIFLSIGYSTCHWCHVMERECFENESIAKLMNENYVNIKVDREERPDMFVQATTGSGGWPLSVFLTPDLRPFFGATYIAPEDEFNRTGFKTVLLLISKRWKSEKSNLIRSSEAITKAINDSVVASYSVANHLDLSVVKRTLYHLINSFDSENGGFGDEPKFPTPVNFEFLLSFYSLGKLDNGIEFPMEIYDKALNMVSFTLKKMGKGGIHDHIGGGFHRYSTDNKWHVPHFEKMLYDQAQLLSAYSTAYSLTKDDTFKSYAKDIVNYCCSKLLHPSGGFYSAEDADSFPSNESKEKKEGAFYVWEADELRGILNNDFNFFCQVFGVKEKGNVDPKLDTRNELTNKNILIQNYPLEQIAANFNLSVNAAEQKIKELTKLLNEIREKRPKPHLDDKILTGWNSLMISGLCKAYAVFGDEEYIQLAVKTHDFIVKNFMNKEYTLKRSFRDGPSEIDGFADDYAFFIQCLLDLYDNTYDEAHLDLSEKLQGIMNDKFLSSGCEYFLCDKNTDVTIKTRVDHDGAEPSFNSVAALNLLRLHNITGNIDYANLVDSLFTSFGRTLSQHPHSMPFMVKALHFSLTQPIEFVFTGDFSSEDGQKILQFVRELSFPNKCVLFLSEAMKARLKEKKPWLLNMNTNDMCINVCYKGTCFPPVKSLDDIKDLVASI
ncbi:spermatogenesis-associated protein 20 [Rozella allomycis CSF55]|uniref:Spermatogenesis-associated protein 20 n=1 Tax=Rozella allomycis (strain CSF55) TaxID=988480 RepID=A0A4P9YL94_ROZAC|nr:spermatogenesis-associated protein 20 [Rozella allomycis CSF55]